MIKYPRTPHLEGSRLQKGDEDLSQVPAASLKGRHLVVEEKVDGANAGIGFAPDGSLRLQCRGHFLTGGPREAQFSLFKQWAATHADDLRKTIGTRYVIYGEWLFAKHTVFYDRLPHYFLEYDVLDKERGEWLSTPRRRELLERLPIAAVPVLFEGACSHPAIVRELAGRSHYISPEARVALKQSCGETGYSFEAALKETDTSGRMEGLYIKVEENGCVAERLKWIRSDFIQALLSSGSHWQDRPIVPNRLCEGADIWQV